MILIILFLAACFLAYSNGANDNFKGVATIFGSGTTNYKKAIIWGDTVNTASRMESSGEIGKVNISESTYKLLRDDPDFTFESRGKIQAKGKGEIEMYFVTKTSWYNEKSNFYTCMWDHELWPFKANQPRFSLYRLAG